MGDMEDPLGHLPVLQEKWERAVEDADLDAYITQWMGIVQDLYGEGGNVELVLENHVGPVLGKLQNVEGDTNDHRIGVAFLRALYDKYIIRSCFDYALKEKKRNQGIAQGLKERDFKGPTKDADEQQFQESQQKTKKWLFVAETLFGKHHSFLVPLVSSDDNDLDPTNLWGDDKKTALHLAAIYSCPTLMGQLLDKTKEVHGREELGRRAILSRTTNGRTALVYSIEARDIDCIKALLEADTRFLEYSWGLQPRHQYPLHDLVLLYTKNEYRQKPLDNTTSMAMLAALVKANPVRALTNRCGRVAIFLGGKWETMEDIPPYTMATRALRQFRNIPGLEHLRSKMLEHMIQKLNSVDMEAAIHGDTTFENKITHLDLSDFDYLGTSLQQNDLGTFVKNFQPIPGCFELADILLFVRLPNMMSGDLVQISTAISDLFDSLRWKFGVLKIVRLEAKQTPRHPFADEIMAGIINTFKVEDLDWRKYDMDTSLILPNSSLRNVTLYSTGHWGVLHHWTSKEGIVTLANIINFQQLQEARIQLTQSNSVIYERMSIVVTRRNSRLTALPEKINRRLTDLHGELFAHKVKVEPEIPFVPRSETPYRPKPVSQRFFDAFRPTIADIKSVSNESLGVGDKKFDQFRIKVAIIDNGIDIGLSTISGNVRKGKSLESIQDGWTLPWFTALDAHGTQMADLVVHVDPFCELYIYRITSLPTSSINFEWAAQAIDCAIADGVDIINLSWSFNQHHPVLEEALKNAASPRDDKGNPKAPTLIFSAKSDKLYTGDLYPADYTTTISVAAATSRGRIGTEGSKDPDLLILGENMPAEGPDYMSQDEQAKQVTGSSVATALASGMASLLLTLAKKRYPLHWTALKQKEAMKALFKKFREDGPHSAASETSLIETTYVNPIKMFANPAKETAKGLGIYMQSVVSEFFTA